MLDQMSPNKTSSMTTNPGKRSIRIVKRNETEPLNEESAPTPTQLKTENQSRREMVETITSWIHDRREMMKTLPDLRNSMCWSQSAHDVAD
ncbi:MAG TPA: hypothetical protein VGN86_02915 [Pyrinomonadaceae bacterium]|nr:hypothetical protein [Pyrinomonadaceae bacterium]